jgi:hypothetical protein
MNQAINVVQFVKFLLYGMEKNAHVVVVNLEQNHEAHWAKIN